MSKRVHLSNYDQSGSAAVLVTVAMLVLIAFAALALDASLGYDERRDAQNAADNAAYAAAYDDCNPKDTAAPNPQKAAREVALQNGFDHSQPDLNVIAVENPPSSGIWTVTIEVLDIDSAFGVATPYAPDQLDITATATAHCAPDPFLGGYAVFAGAVGCPQPELDISGANVFVDGDVHTNEDVQITGSSPVVTGDITYVPPGGAAPLNGETASATTQQNYPLDPNLINDYRPGGSRALAAGANYHDLSAFGNIKNVDMIAQGFGTGGVSNIQLDTGGIYYSSGNLELKGVTLGPGVTITLVAEGTISIIADGDIVGFDDVDPSNPNSTKLTAFSWNVAPPVCAPGPANAVNVSANTFDWEGLIFAPNGLVSFSTSSGTTLDGSIIAYMVNLSGSDLSITYDDSANANPKFILELLR